MPILITGELLAVRPLDPVMVAVAAKIQTDYPASYIVRKRLIVLIRILNQRGTFPYLIYVEL